MISTILAVGIAAVAICTTIVLTRDWHIRFTGDHDDESHHKVHSGSVPRVGGLAIYFAGLLGLAMVSSDMEPQLAKMIWSMWAAMSFVVCVGLYEDLTRTVSASKRMLATLVGALIFSIANGGLGITYSGLFGVDWLLQFHLAQVLFFALVVAGGTHAFNLVDGQNGLCAGVAATCFAGFSFAAFQVGDTVIGQISAIMAAANVGFLCLNYPFGKLFLGDSGAYFNGGVLCILGTLLIERSGGAIHPYFGLLAVAYPVTETVYSMFRRRLSGQRISEPDTEHLHHLFFAKDRQRTNVLARSSAPRLWILNAMPIIAACHYYDSPLMMGLGFVGFVALYHITYRTAKHRLPNESHPTGHAHAR